MNIFNFFTEQVLGMKWLSNLITKFKGISGATVSALLGTVTPFCSCSSIPIFIGFSNAGLPLGVTFSFLISSSMVDVASLLLLAGFFGMNISILYVVLGLIIAIIGGTIISNCSKIEKQFPGSIAVGSFKFWKYNGFTRL